VIGISEYSNRNRNTKLDCPECLDKTGENLKKVYREDFYRCSGCKNEWFEHELIKTKYKTATFVNEKGKRIYVAQTPKRLEEMKIRGVYDKVADKRKRQPNGRFSRRDKNLLRRLRK
jgi:transposase-like protein